jgi:hypothetical protein
MEPKDEIDDTAYFKTMRAEQEAGSLPPDGPIVGAKWFMELNAKFCGEHFYRAAGRITPQPEDGSFYDFDLPDQYTSYEEAIAAAREFATDWIAQQPIE